MQPRQKMSSTKYIGLKRDIFIVFFEGYKAGMREAGYSVPENEPFGNIPERHKKAVYSKFEKFYKKKGLEDE